MAYNDTNIQKNIIPKPNSHHRHLEITPPSLRVFLSCKAKDLQLKNVSRTIETIQHHTLSSRAKSRLHRY